MNRKATQTAVLLVSLSLVVGIAVHQGMPLLMNLIDKEVIKKAIEEGLHESTGVNFRIRELTLEPTLFQGLQVHLNTSAITDMRKNPLGSIENMTVQIRYLPLLTRQLPEIAKIHLNHVRIPIGKVNFFREIKLKLVKPKQTGFLKPAELHDTEVLLSDYLIEDVKLANTTRKLLHTVQRFRVEGKQVSIRHLESKKPISIKGSGALAYLLNPSGQPEGNPAHQTIGSYHILIEIPQAAVKKGKLSAEGLGKLALKLQGPGLRMDLDYKHQLNQTGQGSIRANPLDLQQIQTLALQLGDTFGLPLPKELSQAFARGKARLSDNRFTIDFSKPNPALTMLAGTLSLDGVSVAQAQQWPKAMVEGIRGNIQLKGKAVQIPKLEFRLGNLPLMLQGGYHLDTDQVDAVLIGKGLRVNSLRETAARFTASGDPLQGRNIKGLIDVYAHLSGTGKNPSYKGLIAIRDGSFEDASQGLLAQHVNGQVRFEGAGLQHPSLRYNGTVQVLHGQLVSQKQGIQVNRFDGKVAFNGQIAPTDKTPRLPSYSGQINVQEARYQDPKTGVLVQGIRGLIRLADQQIHLDHFRGLLASSEFLADGAIQPNLLKPMQSGYQLRLRGNHIQLKNLKNEVLAKLPQAQSLLHQLDPYSGEANLNLTARTGLQVNGRVDVNGLGIRSAQSGTPLKAAHISVLFNNHSITVPTTKLYYGEVGLTAGGQAQQSGTYRFQLATDEVPVSFLRDQQKTLNAISGMALPEIWNTAGSFAAHGNISNQGVNMALAFYDAGLSWRGGDFPLYDLNGTLDYKQTGKETPVISGQNLNFRYGNSPARISIDSHKMFQARTEGILSPLTVNHFLVSRQSEATPYREVPFQVTAMGALGGLPGTPAASRNNLETTVLLDLNANLKTGYNGPAKPTTNEQAMPEGSSFPLLRKNVSSVISLNPLHTVQGILGLAKQTVQTGLDIVKLPIQGVTSAAQAVKSGVANNAPQPEPQPVTPAPEPIANQEASDSNAYLAATLHLQGEDLKLDKAKLHLFDGGDILADGEFKNVMAIGQRAFMVHVVTVPELDLGKLSQGAAENNFLKDATGTVGADLQFAANSAGLKLGSGWLSANKVAIPYLTLRDISGKAVIDGETGTAEVSRIEVPGISASLSARTDNVFEIPVTLEDVKIRGDLLSIESLASFNEQIVKPILVDQLAHSFLRPWQQGDPLIPIQFRDADLEVNEVIFQNILLNHLTSRFSLYANSLMELNNTHLEAAGGTAHGYLSMSPNDYNFMSLELNVDNVKANALTKALLNTTNQIFGDVSGTVRFTTYGDTDVKMQENANGTVRMKVTNGRLPAIAKVETLLTTANIFRGGILGLNLNNLFRSLMFYDTNYFAELSGDMLIAHQVLYTENLISDGVNLDLLIQGSLRMDNGNADMLVNGQMSQDVAGLFGTIGQISLGRLVRFIPGIGTLGKNKSGLLGYIPGVGYVPGFGGPAGNFSRFQVRLAGSLEDPSAIRDFHWAR